MQTYELLAGAALVDTGLIRGLRPWVDRVPDPGLGHLFQVLVDLWEHDGADITVSMVLAALGSHPARDRVAGLVENARTADDPARLFQDAVEFLQQREHKAEKARLQAHIKELEPRAADDPAAAEELDRLFMRLMELQKRLSPA